MQLFQDEPHFSVQIGRLRVFSNGRLKILLCFSIIAPGQGDRGHSEVLVGLLDLILFYDAGIFVRLCYHRFLF